VGGFFQQKYLWVIGRGLYIRVEWFIKKFKNPSIITKNSKKAFKMEKVPPAKITNIP
jgi:hypothetical protein